MQTPLNRRSRLSVTPAPGQQTPDEVCPRCQLQFFLLLSKEPGTPYSSEHGQDTQTPTKATILSGRDQGASTPTTTAELDDESEDQDQDQDQSQNHARDEGQGASTPAETIAPDAGPAGNSVSDSDKDMDLPDADRSGQTEPLGATDAATDTTALDVADLPSSQLLAEEKAAGAASSVAANGSAPTPRPASGKKQKQPKRKAAVKVVKPAKQENVAKRKKLGMQLIKAAAQAESDAGASSKADSVADADGIDERPRDDDPAAPSPQPQEIIRAGLIPSQTTLDQSSEAMQGRMEMQMTKLLAATHDDMPDPRIQACVRKACAISQQAVVEELLTSIDYARRRQGNVDGRELTDEVTLATTPDSSWSEGQLRGGFRRAWRSIQSIGSDVFVRTVVYRRQLAELHRIYTAWQAKCYTTAKQQAFELAYPNLGACSRADDPVVKSARTRFDNDLKFAAKMAKLEEVLGRDVFVMLPAATFPHEFFRILPLLELETWAKMVRDHCWPDESFPPWAMSVVQALLRPEGLKGQPFLPEIEAWIQEGDRARLLQASGVAQDVQVAA